MNLRQQILKEHSKANSLLIADWVGADQERFAQLLHLMLNDEYRVVQRAAWSLSFIADRHPELMAPHLEALVRSIGQPGVADAVKRNVLRMLQHVPLPEALHGPLMNLAFRFLEDPAQPIAVRVFSMTVLGRLALVYPELKSELRAVIGEILAREATPAFRARSKAVLKQIA